MNHAPGGKSLLLEIGQNTAIESLGFSEIGVSQCGRLIRVAFADVLFTDADAGKTYSFTVTETKLGGKGYANDTAPRTVTIAPGYDAATGRLTVNAPSLWKPSSPSITSWTCNA